MVGNNDYLKELEEQSLKKQKEFMQGIARRLGRPALQKPAGHPFRGAPDFWKGYELPLDERIELFMSNWQKVGGEAHRFADMEQAAEFIADIAEKMEAKYLLRWDQPELEQMSLAKRLPSAEITVWNREKNPELMTKAAGADIGIALVDYAVAHTGSVVAMSGGNKGRTVSLLPTAFIAIIPADRVKTRLGEVMQELNKFSLDSIPAGIHFISGPSRSADIENDLTIGVHGPGIVYALVVG